MAGRALQFLGVDRAVIVRVGLLEQDFHIGKVFVLANRLVVVGVRNGQCDLPDIAFDIVDAERCSPSEVRVGG